MPRRPFPDHPATLGESYGKHGRAAGVSVRMIAGGVAGLVHAAVPRWFRTTGGGTIARLHAGIVAGRARRAAADEEARAGSGDLSGGGPDARARPPGRPAAACPRCASGRGAARRRGSVAEAGGGRAARPGTRARLDRP